MKPLELFTSWRRSLRAYLPANLMQNTAWALSGYGLRLIIQAIYFVIIARSLGVNQYGGFVAATALTAIISPFVGMGTGNLLVKNVARDHNAFPEYWGNGLLMTLGSGIVFMAIVCAFSIVVLPRGTPLLIIVLISLSDLIFVKLLDMAAWAFQAFEMLAQNAQINVLISFTRLAGIATLALVVSHPTVKMWSAFYLAGSVLSGLIAVAWASAMLGGTSWLSAIRSARQTMEDAVRLRVYRYAARIIGHRRACHGAPLRCGDPGGSCQPNDAAVPPTRAKHVPPDEDSSRRHCAEWV